MKWMIGMLGGLALASMITSPAYTQVPDALITPPIPASTPVAVVPTAPSPIQFDDGLSLTVPANWKRITQVTTAAVKHTGNPFQDPDMITLLLDARPQDPQNTAVLTVVRDVTFGAHAGPTARQELFAKLEEIAATQGFHSDKFNARGEPSDPQNILLVELVGLSGDGHRRVFTCVAFNRFPKPCLRLYWQRDDSDLKAQQQFNEVLASVVFDGVNAGNALNGGMQQVAANQPASGQSDLHKTDVDVTGTLSPQASPPSLPSPETGELVTKNRECLVVVEGDKGRGSGFICTMDGQNWLVTNTHVISNNQHPHFNTMSGAKLDLGPAFLAVDHDLCKFKSTSPNALEVMKDMDATVKIGDAIVVLGNAEGQGVIRPFEGHIVGMGPNLVEVDAPFVSGNSGSPIIHVASGKVIGIATYLVIRKVNSAGSSSGSDSNGSTAKKKEVVETTVRRFGYRLDNVKTWEAVVWPRFQSQAQLAETIDSNGEAFIQLFTDANNNNLLASSSTNPGIERAVESFRNRVQTGHISPADLAFARRELLANLRVAALSDINTFDMRNSYDYFRRQILDEKKFRDEIYSGFTQVLNSQSP